MNKTILLGLAAVAALGFASCDTATTSNGATQTGKGDKDVLYSGILPSADAMGTVYTLKLEYDDDHNYTDGDFVMIENTLASDTTTATGFSEAATSYTEGDFTKESKQVGGTTIEYIRLAPDAKDALGTPSAASMYFIVNADGSLTMVGADLQQPAIPDLYTLTVK